MGHTQEPSIPGRASPKPSPEFMWGSPKPLWGGIWRRDLWEVIRVRCGHEGGGLVMGLGSYRQWKR